jgi:CRP-like cAMP-binding protein
LASSRKSPSGDAGRSPGRTGAPANQILQALPRSALDTLVDGAEAIALSLGESLFEPGDTVLHAYFPLGQTVVALVLPMRDGRAVEAATIGREGAVGGVVSLGLKPAFSRAVVQIPGEALRAPLSRVEAAKRASPKTHDTFLRYADCLTAQVLQSVACAALHPIEARCARWLLMTHDRLAHAELPLTQESLAETLGVARTYVTRIANNLQEAGAISYRRGVITVISRSLLERAACECYGAVRQHFDRVLPGLYPQAEL